MPSVSSTVAIKCFFSFLISKGEIPLFVPNFGLGIVVVGDEGEQYRASLFRWKAESTYLKK